MEIRPVVLEGRVVRLEPLSMDHHAALCEVGLDPQLWRWTHSLVRTNEEMARYIQATLDAQAQGRELPFATCERASGRVGQHTLREHRPREPPRGNRLDLDRRALAAHRREHRSKVSHA